MERSKMKHNLLTKTLCTVAVATALTACGVDEGYNPEFKSDKKVVLENDQIAATLDENSGIQTINLLEGATVGGVALSDVDGLIKVGQFNFSANNNFFTPQAPSNSVPNLTVSPFRVSDDNKQLLVDTDAIADSLHFCDSTDVRGARDADDNPIADGFPDFPAQVVYTITYEIDNGADREPGEALPTRTLSLTINAGQDPITAVQTSDITVASGGTAQSLGQLVPSYTCDDTALTYSIANTDIATVDSNGLVTGGGTQGETEMTITSSNGISTVAKITTGPGFALSISNQDRNPETEAPLGTKNVPACSHVGIAVEPSIVNDTLSGTYSYDWMSDSTDVVFTEAAASGFTGLGIFSVGSTNDSVGNSGLVTVGLDASNMGNTGATSIADVVPQEVALNVVHNIACETANPADATTYDFSHGFESTATIGAGGSQIKVSEANGSTRWIATGSMSTVAPAIGEGLAGTNAMKLTVVDADLDPIPANGGIGTLLQRWNGASGSWTASNFGKAASVGKTFKFSVWVKLSSLVTDGQTREITNYMFPWLTAEGNTAPYFTENPSWAKRFVNFNMQLTETLENTTDWQLVEFEETFTIPAEWDDFTAPIKLNFNFSGDFVNGDEILIDDYSVVEQ